MTLSDFLAASTTTLTAAGIQTARLDCLVLLEDELGVGRASILAHPERELDDAELTALHKRITRRAKHFPLAYIRGKAAFFGRNFAVNESVLVPRPETETMIELLKKLPLPAGAKIADIGTGSGCLGITASLELPGSSVWLCDISVAALDVAKANAQTLGANARAVITDLAEPCQAQHFDAVLANLPYVPEQYEINRAAGFEPKLALFAGADGLDAYRTFWQQLTDTPYQPAFVITESLPFQHHAVASLARNAGFALEQVEDFVQLFAKI